MTWRGCDPAIEITSIDALRSYIRSLTYSWRPSNFVIHNTASPTLYQWWHSIPPAQRMENLRHYYENDMGWSAGPHCFIDGKSWWIFTPFNVKGVHSPSWNGTMLGFECVGDYASESDETGMGAEVMRMAHALSGEICEFFGWDPDNLKFHKEDPATDHDCPGRNMVKSEFINDVLQYMGDGGDHGQPPMVAHRGVVSNLAAGDTLNIRASSSSSAAVIGQAADEDVVTVVGEAWNGSTRWLRLQFGDATGTGVAIFGWASDQYIIEDTAPPSSIDPNHTNIFATWFGGSADPQGGAYGGDCSSDTELFLALPVNVTDADQRRRGVRVYNRKTGKSAVGDIRDKGPWMIDDLDYVFGPDRPVAETCYAEGAPLPRGPNAGARPANPAGIDLSPALYAALGMTDNGPVDWEFVD